MRPARPRLPASNAGRPPRRASAEPREREPGAGLPATEPLQSHLRRPRRFRVTGPATGARARAPAAAAKDPPPRPAPSTAHAPACPGPSRLLARPPLRRCLPPPVGQARLQRRGGGPASQAAAGLGRGTLLGTRGALPSAQAPGFFCGAAILCPAASVATRRGGDQRMLILLLGCERRRAGASAGLRYCLKVPGRFPLCNASAHPLVSRTAFLPFFCLP